MTLRLLDLPPMQEDEGEEDTDFTPMSQDGGSRRTFSIDSIMPHRAVDPRPLRSSWLGSTPSSRPRDRSSKLATSPGLYACYQKLIAQVLPSLADLLTDLLCMEIGGCRSCM